MLRKLLDYEEVKTLKARYMRLVDTKGWDELREVLLEDVKARYGSDQYSYADRDSLIEFLSTALGVPGCVSAHHACQPELEHVGTDEMVGTWALRDTVIYEEWGIQIQGAAIYTDRYVRSDGRWWIAETKYERLYEERFPRGSIAHLQMESNRYSAEK